MTRLQKPVKRFTIGTVFERGHRRIVVTLYPGDLIGLRLERTRREYTAPLATVFATVCRWEVDHQRRRFEAQVRELVKSGLPRRAAKKQARKESKNEQRNRYHQLHLVRQTVPHGH